MGQADYLSLGDWNAVCAQCGTKYKASELQKHWTGDWWCYRCWEPRQPQDFVRGIKENPTAPFVQDPADIFIQFCTTVSAISGYAVAGCAITANPSIPDEGAV